MSAPVRPQTAIEGVLSAALLNSLSKVTVYLRHIVITAYIGLTVELDAFYVAVSIVSIFIITFGEIFDSVGIPYLVSAREQGGMESFRRVAGSLFSMTIRMAILLTLLMILVSPFSSVIVPGFPIASKKFINDNLYFLVPYALVYLPYHCLGSFFRSLRNFRLYYWADFLIQVTALGGIVLYHGHELAVPATLSAAYIGGFLFLVWKGRAYCRFQDLRPEREIGEIRRQIVKLVPIYMIGYALLLIDRFFASYLESGAISALSYGFIVGSIIPMILNIENVFITPLSEESDRGMLLTHILSGSLLVSLPVVTFTLLYGKEIITVLFQRGAFTARATELTAAALKFYILGVFPLFFWPVCYRVFQIYRKLRPMMWIGLISVTLNATLNYVFVFQAGMGVAGIALATAISGWAVSVLGLLSLHKLGIEIRFRQPAGMLGNMLLGTMAAVLICGWLPLSPATWGGMFVKGSAFVLTYAAVIFFIPNRYIREIRGMVQLPFSHSNTSR